MLKLKNNGQYLSLLRHSECWMRLEALETSKPLNLNSIPSKRLFHRCRLNLSQKTAITYDKANPTSLWLGGFPTQWIWIVCFKTDTIQVHYEEKPPQLQQIKTANKQARPQQKAQILTSWGETDKSPCTLKSLARSCWVCGEREAFPLLTFQWWVN